jgi:peroxiredoxin
LKTENPKMKIIIAAGVMLFLFASSVPAALKLNDSAPAFSLRDSEGKDFYLSDAVGAHSNGKAKGVVVSFFASWCISCRNELQLINGLTERLNRSGVKVVIVDVKEDFKTIRAVLAELNVDKPVVLSDSEGKAAELYGVRFFPTTFFIGADGSVKHFIYGEIKDEKELLDGVQKLVKK